MRLVALSIPERVNGDDSKAAERVDIARRNPILGRLKLTGHEHERWSIAPHEVRDAMSARVDLSLHDLVHTANSELTSGAHDARCGAFLRAGEAAVAARFDVLIDA
jgi:hypothetical protein